MIDKNGEIITDNLKRIIWWIIRKCRLLYVDTKSGDPFQIYFPWFVNEIRNQMHNYCRSAEVDAIKNLNEEIETQLNKWLDYNCLQGDNSPSDSDTLKYIAKLFVKGIGLKGRIIIAEPIVTEESKRRITELEMEVSRYANENRKLEIEKEELLKKLSEGDEKNINLIVPENGPEIVLSELQDLLINIDNKYPLDVLRSIQLGDDQPITMKNFVSHLFYILRKKGLINYPDQENFLLDYDQSGLYQCLGFEVPPDGKFQVKVKKPGWGLQKGSRLFPIRKAIIKKV